MHKPESLKRSEWASFKAGMFGLAGVSIAFLLHIFGVPSFDTALYVSLYCHVIGIPLLIAIGLTSDIAEHWPDPDIPFSAAMVTMPLMLGPWLTLAGVVSCIWHYSVGASLAFTGASVVAGLGFGIFQHLLLRSGKAKTKHAPTS